MKAKQRTGREIPVRCALSLPCEPNNVGRGVGRSPWSPSDILEQATLRNYFNFNLF